MWFQIRHEGFGEFSSNHTKVRKFTSAGYFCPKYMRFELKKYRGVIFHDTEQWYKIWINLDLVVSKLAWWIGWTFIKAHKSLKVCTLMGSFVQSVIIQLENFRRILCHDTKRWCKIYRKTDSWLEKWEIFKEFGEFSCEHLKV